MDASQSKTWRTQLRKATDEVDAAVEPLLHGWLVDVPEGECVFVHDDTLLIPVEDEAEQTTLLRNAYLPDVVVAYNSVLHYVGHTLSRETLLQCMELATVVAAHDSDVLYCFQQTGRLPELVTAFAISSKAILKAGEMRAGKGGGKRSGAGLGLWDVKA